MSLPSTRERIKALLPVIQAWTEGKPIQYRLTPVGSWRDLGLDGTSDSMPGFDAQAYEWRIKPEPRELWVIWKGSPPSGDHPCLFYDKPSADAWILTYPGGEAKLFREVLE